ncbi:hypothetical protein EMIT0P258_110081 [Pseudomonas sp. IT-P258]
MVQQLTMNRPSKARGSGEVHATIVALHYPEEVPNTRCGIGFHGACVAPEIACAPN